MSNIITDSLCSMQIGTVAKYSASRVKEERKMKKDE